MKKNLFNDRYRTRQKCTVNYQFLVIKAYLCKNTTTDKLKFLSEVK